MIKQFYVYVLRTSGNTLYTGYTNDLTKRISQHKNKTTKSSKYVRSFESFDLVYHEIYLTRKEAMQREYVLKQMTKKQKEELIERRSAKSAKLMEYDTIGSR